MSAHFFSGVSSYMPRLAFWTIYHVVSLMFWLFCFSLPILFSVFFFLFFPSHYVLYIYSHCTHNISLSFFFIFTWLFA